MSNKYFCCCIGTSIGELQKNTPEVYASYPDAKIAACGIAVDYGGSNDGSVVGFCQLSLPGMPGDGDLPSALQHTCEADEAYIDQIVVGAEARGKGIGGRLLAWADQFVISWQLAPITKISLEVIHGNPAIRLYERHGYCVQDKDCVQRCCEAVCMMWLMRSSGSFCMEKRVRGSLQDSTGMVEPR
jgi:ribosomal protein S18 acetylase RimI-like enzyme